MLRDLLLKRSRGERAQALRHSRYKASSFGLPQEDICHLIKNPRTGGEHQQRDAIRSFSQRTDGMRFASVWCYFFGGIAGGGASISAFRLALRLLPHESLLMFS